jgi:cytochrome P450
VPLRVIETYFGVPAPAPAAMMGWMRALFHDLFLNQSDEPEVIARAVAAFGELRRHLEAVIARRRAEAEAGDVTPPSDVLGRMLALQRQDAYRAWLDDDAICRNVSGLIIGALETTSKAVILVIDELFRRPSALREATAAAVAGDVERVRGYAFEALRFNPFVPVLVRHCRAETELGGRKVPAGTLVYAGTLSAMFDGSTVERPAEFRADRSLEYLHFGYGLHRCQGRLVNNVQVPELVMHILRLKGLRRASGSSGKVVYDGPFPDRFIVEFDPI